MQLFQFCCEQVLCFHLTVHCSSSLGSVYCFFTNLGKRPIFQSLQSSNKTIHKAFYSSINIRKLASTHTRVAIVKQGITAVALSLFLSLSLSFSLSLSPSLSFFLSHEHVCENFRLDNSEIIRVFVQVLLDHFMHKLIKRWSNDRHSVLDETFLSTKNVGSKVPRRNQEKEMNIFLI